MKAINFLFLISLLVACNAKKNEAEKTDTPQPATKEASPINCYSFANENDTITLKLIHIGNSITGTLVYNLKEKDKNRGTIQGAMKDNVLIADYTFMAEGMQSVRQVAFKMDGSSLVEGYGDIYIQNDKAYFKNIDSLNFDSTRKLAEVACQ